MDIQDECEVYDCHEPQNGKPVVADWVVSIQPKKVVRREFKLCEEHFGMFVDNTPCYSIAKE